MPGKNVFIYMKTDSWISN